MSESLSFYESVTSSTSFIATCVQSMLRINTISSMPAILKFRQLHAIRTNTINAISTAINNHNARNKFIRQPQIDDSTKSAIMADFTSRLDAAIRAAGISLE